MRNRPYRRRCKRAANPLGWDGAGARAPGSSVEVVEVVEVVEEGRVPALHRPGWPPRAPESSRLGTGRRALMTTADTIDQWRHRVAAVVRAESDDPGRRSAARIVAVRSRIPRL
jgi:hypothetical protein